MPGKNQSLVSGLRREAERFEEVYDETLIRARMADGWAELALLGSGRCFEARALGALVVKRLVVLGENPRYWEWWMATMGALRELCGVQAGWPPYRLLETADGPVLVMPRMQVGTPGWDKAEVAAVQTDLARALAARKVAVRDHWQWGLLAGRPYLLDLSDLEPVA